MTPGPALSPMVLSKLCKRVALPFAILALATSCSSTGPSATPAITITLGSQTLAITQGQSNTVTITLARTNFTGDVSLAATGLPTGVTASFNPPTMTGTATGTTLTLAASSSATPGAASVVVEASGTGITKQTATLAVTVNVAGNYTLAMAPASVSLVQGGTVTSTVNVTRNGGFTGAVALAATGLPSGVTAAFNPASVTATSSTLTLTATATAATGPATVTITGTSPGLSAVTANLALTVSAPGTPSRISIDFCSKDIPLWFAYQNEGGAWTRVVGDANGTFVFDATPKVGVTLVFATGSGTTAGFDTEVFYMTRADVEPLNGVPCAESQGAKTLNGSVAGLGTNQFASVQMAGSYAQVVAPATTYSFTTLPDGALDLVAQRNVPPATGTGPATPDRVIIRRGVNLATGAAIPVLDFATSEAVALATNTVTVTGAAAGDVTSAFTDFVTRPTGGPETFAFISSIDVAGGSGTFSAVPASLTIAGDMHSLFVMSGPSAGGESRGAATFFRSTANKSVALGAPLSTPTVTQAATTPYVRLRGQLASQADYGDQVMFNFSQSTRSASLSATAGYLGATPATWDLTMPDFSAIAGWQNTWALQPGAVTVDVSASSAGASVVGLTPADGTTYKTATRSSSTTATMQAATMYERLGIRGLRGRAPLTGGHPGVVK